MLRRISAPKMEAVAGGWRRLHNALHNLYSQNIIRLINSTRMRWAKHVASMEEMKTAYEIFVGN
jgi:hypothetical protein